MDGFVAILLLLTVVPIMIATMCMPYLTRRTESFGVLIPEDVYHSNQLQSMRKQYAKVTGMFSLLAVVVFLLLSLILPNDQQTTSILISVGVLFYIIGTFFVYLRFHRQMKQLKANEKWGKEKPQQTVIHTGFRDQKLTYSNGWFIISFVISFAMIIITYWLYDQIPDSIPMQYNYSGEVTNWAEKSYRTVMVMPIMQVYLTILFLFINTMIGKAKQQLNAENPEKSIQQTIVFRRVWSAYIIITGIALTLLFAVIQLSFIYPIDPTVLVVLPLLFGLAVTAGAIVLAFTTGQGGSRVKTSTGKKGEIIDRDDDQYWKLGQLYFNPSDPALFLEKRFGIGWTINFARPLAWIMFLVIILLAMGIPLLLVA
ncbi:DUF1648 domain-containing protein [Halalkalibacter kiskunsagensis]|uniref:DUF1648 domain-containing protein n=1 Tax=Halalkalibacter kiskunsagensis TaxID=1548599 RepID=A0ABV6KEJ4_9BACI